MNQLEQKQRINDILRYNDLPSAEELIEKSFYQAWNLDERQEYLDGPEQEDVAADPVELDPEEDSLEPEVPEGVVQELLAPLTRQWSYPNASRTRSDIARDFEECYQTYVQLPIPNDGDDPEGQRLLEKLVIYLGELNTYVIFRKIHSFSFYQTTGEMDLTHEGHRKAIRSLWKDRTAGILRPHPTAYYCSIYKNVTLDLLRYYNICRKKKEDEGDSVKSPIYAIRNAVSLERLTTSADGEDMSDHFEELGVSSDEEDRRYHSSMCSKILTHYFRSLLDYDHTPPAPLALMYARVLYNVERLFNTRLRDRGLSACLKKHEVPEDQIPETAAKFFRDLDKQSKATSAQWAMLRMGKSTIAKLIDESEAVLQRHFGPTMKWCSGIRRRLEQPSGKGGEKWRDIIYTEAYTQRTVAQYALDCHESMLVKTGRKIKDDQELMEYIRTTGCGGSLNPILRMNKHNKKNHGPAI